MTLQITEVVSDGHVGREGWIVALKHPVVLPVMICFCAELERQLVIEHFVPCRFELD